MTNANNETEAERQGEEPERPLKEFDVSSDDNEVILVVETGDDGEEPDAP
jgi:hypothetical protein